MKWELELKNYLRNCFNAFISFNFPGVQPAPLQQEYRCIQLLNHCSTMYYVHSGNKCDALIIIFMTTKFCPLHVHCYLFTLQQSSVYTMFQAAG